MASPSQPPSLPFPPHAPGPQPTLSLTAAVLTAREAVILPHILLCTKEEPSRLQFDWDKLAQRMGMKNPRSAANSWLAVRKKIEAISSASANPPKLTQNDQRFLANAVSCTKRPLDVDYAALASRLGMTNPRSASNAWGAIRKKISVGSECAAIGERPIMKRATERRKVKGYGSASTTTRRPAAKDVQPRVQIAEPTATAQPFPFKVVKCENEKGAKEKQLAGYELATPESRSDAYCLSINQAPSLGHMHALALPATYEGEEYRLKVKEEPFDEC